MALPMLALPFIGKVLSKVVGPVILKIMAVMGLSVVAYQGLQVGLTELRSMIEAEMLSLPVEVIDVLGAIKIDVYVSMVFSAIVVKWTIKGLAGGVMKAFRMG
jgi:hypothetical protein